MMKVTGVWQGVKGGNGGGEGDASAEADVGCQRRGCRSHHRDCRPQVLLRKKKPQPPKTMFRLKASTAEVEDMP